MLNFEAIFTSIRYPFHSIRYPNWIFSNFTSGTECQITWYTVPKFGMRFLLGYNLGIRYPKCFWIAYIKKGLKKRTIYINNSVPWNFVEYSYSVVLNCMKNKCIFKLKFNVCELYLCHSELFQFENSSILSKKLGHCDPLKAIKG